jgi:hypothetical protein
LEIKSLPINKRSRPDGFSTEFCQNSKEIMSVLQKRVEREESLPNPDYVMIINLIQKPDRDRTEEEN